MSTDLKIGDYAEACHVLPGIVQVIEGDHCELFYQFFKDKDSTYTGGSCCSIKHCGVTKISKERYDMLYEIGEEKLLELWKSGPEHEFQTWEEKTNNYYNNIKIAI
jgi:hypothetical protein